MIADRDSRATDHPANVAKFGWRTATSNTPRTAGSSRPGDRKFRRVGRTGSMCSLHIRRTCVIVTTFFFFFVNKRPNARETRTSHVSRFVRSNDFSLGSTGEHSRGLLHGASGAVPRPYTDRRENRTPHQEKPGETGLI